MILLCNLRFIITSFVHCVCLLVGGRSRLSWVGVGWIAGVTRVEWDDHELRQRA